MPDLPDTTQARIDLIDEIIMRRYRDATFMGGSREDLLADFIADFTLWAHAEEHSLADVLPRGLEHALREIADPDGHWVFEHGSDSVAEAVKERLVAIRGHLVALHNTAVESQSTARPGRVLAGKAEAWTEASTWTPDLATLWQDATEREPEWIGTALAHPAFAAAVPHHHLRAALSQVPESVRTVVFAVLGRGGGRGR